MTSYQTKILKQKSFYCLQVNNFVLTSARSHFNTKTRQRNQIVVKYFSAADAAVSNYNLKH